MDSELTLNLRKGPDTWEMGALIKEFLELIRFSGTKNEFLKSSANLLDIVK